VQAPEAAAAEEEDGEDGGEEEEEEEEEEELSLEEMALDQGDAAIVRPSSAAPMVF
jgi:hypothetical protein